jgi:hypothetical protein
VTVTRTSWPYGGDVAKGDVLMSVGPVDVVVADFPSETLHGGRLTNILGDLVSTNSVRIFDLVFVRRIDAQQVEILEADDLDDELKIMLAQLDGQSDSMLSDEDVRAAADRVPAGHTAIVVAWENIWAARMADDVVEAGGAIVAHERVPADVVEAAVADLARSAEPLPAADALVD